MALVTGGLFLLAVGFNPFAVYDTMISGAVGTVSNLREMVKIAIPLCIASLGVTLAFRMRFGTSAPRGRSPSAPLRRRFLR